MMGKKKVKKIKKAILRDVRENQMQPSPSGYIPIEHGSRASFTVYAIQNGYLMRCEPQVAAPHGLVFCEDIQDLCEQILSSEAQMRLNLK